MTQQEVITKTTYRSGRANKLSQIIALLGSLSRDELQQVRLIIQNRLLNGSLPAEADRQIEESEMFYYQVVQAMKQRGIMCPPWNAVTKMPKLKSFNDKFTKLEPYTHQYFGKPHKRDRQRLYQIYASTLINWIEQNPYVPLTVSTVLQNVDKIPELIANAFPGYAQSGLLPALLKMGDPKNAQEETNA